MISKRSWKIVAKTDLKPHIFTLQNSRTHKKALNEPWEALYAEAIDALNSDYQGNPSERDFPLAKTPIQ